MPEAPASRREQNAQPFPHTEWSPWPAGAWLTEQTLTQFKEPKSWEVCSRTIMELNSQAEKNNTKIPEHLEIK